ncbi:hypothetical protein AgCh_036795 [Apium graveolens]
MSELSPARIELFGDSVDAWIRIACPRLSIDWGDAFVKPILNAFEAEIVLGDLPGWWERSGVNSDCSEGVGCQKNESCCGSNCTGKKEEGKTVADYPMDYYAQDGGEWNSSYSKKQSRPSRRILALPSILAPQLCHEYKWICGSLCGGRGGAPSVTDLRVTYELL